MDLLNFGKILTRLFHLCVHTSASTYSQVRKLKKKKETQNHEVYREISDSSLQQPDGYGLYTEEDLLCSIFLAAL